jgi:hypothetical protein
MTIFSHALTALMLGDFCFSFFLERTHINFCSPKAPAGRNPTTWFTKLQLTSLASSFCGQRIF